MSVSFNAQQGAVVVVAELEGPTATVHVRLALDTGATTTMVRTGMLALAGHDPSQAVTQQTVVTASGVETLPVVFTKHLDALGQKRTGFPVLAHTLPPGTGLDGVLGLDFFRGLTLTIDFRQGLITLT